MVRFVVFGASGKVGQKVVAKLLADGHAVRAFVYGNNPFATNPYLEVMHGDVYKSFDVRSAMKDCDVVISTLGSWGTKGQDILSSGMATIIPAMKVHKIKRIVSLTGASALDASDKPSVIDKLTRTLLKLIAPKILADGDKHIALLRQSGLDWTVVRSPVMTEHRKPRLGYSLSMSAPLPWATIERDDVVRAIIDLAMSEKHHQTAPFIKRAR